MAYEISPVEHGQILADIKHLKEDAKQLNERVDDLEKKAWQNDVDHESYKKIADPLVFMTTFGRKSGRCNEVARC